MIITSNDVQTVDSLLWADCEYGKIAVYVNLDVSDIKLLEIALSKDYKHIAEQFNRLKELTQ